MNGISLHDLAPEAAASLDEVVRGLHSPQKELPCKLLYDERGSELFEQITALDEYYPTRAEMRIMRAAGAEMAARLGAESLLIEYGSGSSTRPASSFSTWSDRPATCRSTSRESSSSGRRSR